MRADYFQRFEKDGMKLKQNVKYPSEKVHGNGNANLYMDGKTHTQYGTIGLMCPHCFHVFYATINLTCYVSVITERGLIDVLQNTVYETDICESCGKYAKLIELDPNIAETISLLNKKGYLTKFCCEGHNERRRDNGYIYFKDRSIEDYLHTLPISWYIDLEDIRKLWYEFNPNRGYVIRCDSFNKAEALYDINQWAKTLPTLER